MDSPPGQDSAVKGDVVVDQLLIQAEGQGPERPRLTAPGSRNQMIVVEIGFHTS